MNCNKGKNITEFFSEKVNMPNKGQEKKKPEIEDLENGGIRLAFKVFP